MVKPNYSHFRNLSVSLVKGLQRLIGYEPLTPNAAIIYCRSDFPSNTPIEFPEGFAKDISSLYDLEKR